MGDIFSLDQFKEFFTPERLRTVLRIGVTLVVGLLCFRIIAFIVARITKRHLTPQASMIIRKVIFYTGIVIVILVVLRQAGVSLAGLLGAAGVVGIALGFAAQKSISNLISGIFLVSEKPFAIEDVIKIGDTVGIVTSIDLLSIKIRTFDNLYIRIPSEEILNSKLTTITRYPIRRLDFDIGVAYKEDLKKVREVLFELAENNPNCLDEPPPLFLVTDFADSAVKILFGVWFEKSDYLTVKNEMMIAIKEEFDARGIELPFPHLTVYTGSVTAPYPVEVREARAKAAGSRTGAAGGSSRASTGSRTAAGNRPGSGSRPAPRQKDGAKKPKGDAKS